MNLNKKRAALACSAALLAAGCGGGSGGGGGGARAPAAANMSPVIEKVSNQSFDEDSIAGPIAMQVSDAETMASALSVTARSSDSILLPDAGIEIVGDGEDRSIALIPAPGQSGTATVTVEVADGDGALTAMNFDVTVNPLFRGEFSSWMRAVVLVPDASDEPIGVLNEDGTPLTDVEDIPRIKFTDDSADDPTAYDDLLPAVGAPPFED